MLRRSSCSGVGLDNVAWFCSPFANERCAKRHPLGGHMFGNYASARNAEKAQGRTWAKAKVVTTERADLSD